MVLFDGEFIEDCVKVKTSKIEGLLAEKKHSSREYSKVIDFGENAKGQFWPIFMADLLQLKKIRTTYQI